MPRKAWLVTLTSDGQTKTVDVVPARKKISQIDRHLSDVYAQLLDGDFADLSAFITHPSGQESILEKDGHIVRAQLTQVDDETYARFENAADDNDTDW